MEQLVLLLSLIALGALLRRTSLFDEQSALVLNRLIVYLFIPALTLKYVPEITFSPALIWLSVTPFIIYLWQSQENENA